MLKINIITIIAIVLLCICYFSFSNENNKKKELQRIYEEKKNKDDKSIFNNELSLKNLQQENSNLQQENSNLQQENSNLQQENSNLQQENSNLQQENKELNTNNIKLKEIMEDLKKQLDIKTNKTSEINISLKPVNESSLSQVFPRTYRMKGPALSKDPSFFRILQITTLSKEQKSTVVDLIADYKNVEEQILTKTRGNTIRAEEIVSELEENLFLFEQKFLEILSKEQKAELDLILDTKK
jgi:DNA repair exonuclease SbcCD ATPase subunit